DIWDGEVFREFRGPNDKPFLEAYDPKLEVHLIFSLFVNWFNPLGNKQSGKHISFGIIYLACNNLPVHLQCQMENIYLAGIIPGPQEPLYDQLNHVL
ncbi:hypothetical protein M404DRAFT_101311, partial [Pisolithus tinctorius Marx 270]